VLVESALPPQSLTKAAAANRKQMTKTFILMLCFASAGRLTAAQEPPSPVAPKPQKDQVVTPARVNGVYRYYKNEFRILALGHNQLQIQFDGFYMTVTRSPHIGYAAGIATITGNAATFRPKGTTHCKITLQFLPAKLAVTQDGTDADCDFGQNVYATGIYRKIRSGKPRFAPRD